MEYSFMDISTDLKYTIEILMLLSFILGFLTSYLWKEHRDAIRIDIENTKEEEK